MPLPSTPSAARTLRRPESRREGGSEDRGTEYRSAIGIPGLEGMDFASETARGSCLQLSKAWKMQPRRADALRCRS